MKYTVANDELNLKGKSGLYCFLPYERLDKSKRAIFKCGMTTQEFAARIENYHSYYPLGVYMCFFLSPPRMKRGQDKDKTIREMERILFQKIQDVGGKRMQFPSRPTQKWDYSSEWFYTSFSELSDAFESVSDLYAGSKLEQFDSTEFNKNFEKNMKSKHKYVAEIVYFV
jgi:hypothetical protein